MNQLDELLKETEEAIYSNEYNTIEFHKVKNCTRATLEELLEYLKTKMIPDEMKGMKRNEND